jgi:hypothetical protein
MQFASDYRDHALVLMEVAKRHPASKEQALALAHSWLILATIEDQFTVVADQAEWEGRY